jgi:hypothetical protein
MKPRNREINIFNMSLLDILCGALGAFCFMMLTLFPFYTRAKSSSGDGGSVEQLQEQVDQLQQQLEQTDQQLEEANQHRNSVYIWARWYSEDDVDLWVRDQEGWSGPKPDQLRGRTDPKSVFKISDQTRGPGFERLWVYNVGVGSQYSVFYSLGGRAGGSTSPVRVRGWMLMSTSRNWWSIYDFGEIELSRPRELQPVLTVKINPQWNLEEVKAANPSS